MGQKASKQTITQHSLLKTAPSSGQKAKRAFNQFVSFFVSLVGSTWQLCCAKWASARQWFSPRWQQGRAHSSWPTPSTSSSLHFASASRWCLCLLLCAISERLVSLNHPHLPPNGLPLPLLCLNKHQTPWLLMAIITSVHIFTHCPSSTNATSVVVVIVNQSETYHA